METLFPQFPAIKQQERKLLIEWHEMITKHGEPDNTSRKRSIPLFRYIPSKQIMKRIIMRATKLPSKFTEFSSYY